MAFPKRDYVPKIMHIVQLVGSLHSPIIFNKYRNSNTSLPLFTSRISKVFIFRQLLGWEGGGGYGSIGLEPSSAHICRPISGAVRSMALVVHAYVLVQERH